jgi:peptide/nickel transport system permease protein
MIYEARGDLLGAWWIPAAPALALVTVVMALNLLGDALRDALDVRTGSLAGSAHGGRHGQST